MDIDRDVDREQEMDEKTPLVSGADRVDPRLKMLDSLLDKTGYGVFHIILLIGELTYRRIEYASSTYT